ncbi:MAG TPA: hypothetical protein VFH22_10915 [Rhodocyclaceae bacterium]|nr:hypothetical protein [Rhodocyclaceae bacterium]
MKPIKPLTRFLVFFAFCALANWPAAAADVAATSAAAIDVKRARVLELKAQAKALRQNAEAAHQKESAECRRTVLVNNCLSRAGDRRLEKIEQARGLENEVGALERDIRYFELAERRAERARRLAERKLPTTVNVEGAKETTLPAGSAAAPAPELKGK